MSKVWLITGSSRGLGQLFALMKESAGTDPGAYGSDPAKVAQVLVKMVNEPDPPLRLLIGSDALRFAIANDEAKLAEARKWQAVSVSTDHVAK